MMKYTLFWLLIMFSNIIVAQNRNGNYLTFSVNKGLNFKDTSSYPTFFKSKCAGTYVNSAAIANKEGKLLMYYAQDTYHLSIGKGGGCAFQYFGYIVDSTGNKIKGSDSIYSSIGEDAECVFLPDPEDSTIYWFFTIENSPTDTGYYLLYIKFKVNSSGITVIARENHAYKYNFRNAIRAVKHGNGRDWWILSKDDSNNQWIRFLLTRFGLSSPQFQNYGTLPYSIGGAAIMSISVDGKHIFLPVGPDIVSFNFDRCSGLLSKYQRFHDTSTLIVAGGLYLSAFYDTGTQNVIATNCKYISLYSLFTIDTLITTFKIVHTLDSFNDTSYNGNIYGPILYNPLNPKHLYITLTRLYYTCYPDSASLRNTLSLINYSDTSHITVKDSFLTLGTSDEIFIPGFIQPNYNLGRLVGSVCDTITQTTNIIEFKPELLVYPNPSKLSFNVTCSEYGNVTIYDVLGRSILTENIEPGEKNINCSQWPQGVYIVTVKYRNGYVENRKIVKE